MYISFLPDSNFNIEKVTFHQSTFNVQLGDLSAINLETGGKITTKDAKLENFKRALRRRFGYSSWKLYAQLMFLYSKPEKKTPSSCDVHLRGEILDVVHQLLYHGDKNSSLSIRACVRGSRQYVLATEGNNEEAVADEPLVYENLSFDVSAMTPMVPENTKKITHSCYVQEGVPITSQLTAGTESGWNISIQLDIGDFIYLEEILPDIVSTNAKIFEEMAFCDMSLVCDDDTEIPCHKTFLYTKSPVFKANLSGDFQEKKENKLAVPNMSVDGVKALLAFIYCDEICAALVNPEIALELLIASDKYDIPMLWRAMSAIFEQKPNSWCDVDTALSVYDYANKCPDRKEGPRLEQRMIKVLLEKQREDLLKSEVFQVMFKNKTAQNMFIDVMETKKTK